MAAVETADWALDGFHDDPARSHTLPGRFYYDPGIFADETAAIFHRSWQYAGHVSQLPEPGDYAVREIGDESVILLRDAAGELRGFYNVCQHRGHRLLEGEGHLEKIITCPYHAWAYDLSGALRTARGSERVHDFDKAKVCLKPVRVEALCGFLYFNLDPEAPPLAEQSGRFEQAFRSFWAAPENLTLAYRKEIDVKANWKNIIENYSECYHCPIAHKSLATTAFDMDSYRIEVHPFYHQHTSRDAGDGQGYEYEADSGPRGHEFGGWYLWPNVCFEFYPGGRLTVLHNLPLAPERTLQLIEWYLPEAAPTAIEREIIAFVDEVRLEDIPIVESVQRGLHSRGYGQGRFIVDEQNPSLSEHAVHAFQGKVLAALGAHGAAD
ncbi:MAG: aromatic ring-hydroxylating dioxygenase subunit alpha [Kiloniellales bacterium]